MYLVVYVLHIWARVLLRFGECNYVYLGQMIRVFLRRLPNKTCIYIEREREKYTYEYAYIYIHTVV